MNIQESLRCALIKRCQINEISFDNFLRDNRMIMFQPEHDKSFKVLQIVASAKQKKHNAFLLRCIDELKKLCEAAQIRYAFIKGLGLSYELYEQPEKRACGDVDLLVSKKNAPILLQKLLKHGFYAVTSGDGSISDIMERAESGHQHAKALFKEYEIDGLVDSIMVEIHIFPFECCYELLGTANRDDSYVEVCLQRTRIIHAEGQQIIIPSITDHLYILIMHMMCHYCLDICLYLFAKKNFSSHNIMQNIVDIALYIAKYADIIDFAQLSKLSERHDNLYALKYAFSLVQWLFPEMFDFLPSDDVQLQPRTPIGQACSILASIPPEVYFFAGNIKQHLDIEVLRRIHGRKDICPSGFRIRKNNISILIEYELPLQDAQYCIDVYNIHTVDVTEYILAFNGEDIQLYEDDGYHLLWDAETFGSCNETELHRCYKKSSVTLVLRQNRFELPCSGDSVVEIKKIEQINPFATKYFGTYEQ